MMKSLCLLSRRADLTREDFQRYYEESHAPLGASHFPFAKYVRNHLRDGEDIGFDTISEFWAEDLAKLSGLMTGPVGDIMRADESRFMDRTQIRPGSSQETHLAGPPRGVDETPQRRIALLLSRPEGVAPEAFSTAAKAWGRALGEAAERVTLDELSPWNEPGFPFDAILWIWPAEGAEPALGAPPPELALWGRVETRTAETPPSGLLPA